MTHHHGHIYFHRHLQHQLKELFVAVWIQNFAIQLLALYIPIYFYKLGYSIFDIALYFLVVYVLYFFFIPIGAKIAARIGYEHAIAIAMPVTVLFYLTLFAVSITPFAFFVSAVLFACSKMLYWPAYHADLAQFGNGKQRGREISFLYVVGQLTIFAAPLAAGTILSELSFGWLFLIGSILLIISIVPLLMTPERIFPAKIRYLDLYRHFFSKTYRRRLWTYMGLGEELVAMTIWPIFIFLIVGDFLIFGGILTASMLLGSVLLLLAGKLTDKLSKEEMVHITGLLYFASWFPRLFIISPLGAFLTDSLGQFTKTANIIPITAIAYEEAKQNYAEKILLGTMLFEMGYIVSKIIGALLIMFVALYTNDLRVHLLIGAMFTLFYLLMRAIRNKKAA